MKSAMQDACRSIHTFTSYVHQCIVILQVMPVLKKAEAFIEEQGCHYFGKKKVDEE